tara:strand:+ start:4766 stop:4912 length:147 start_codon:yes stop_codon:yes gene_type:complete
MVLINPVSLVVKVEKDKISNTVSTPTTNMTRAILATVFVFIFLSIDFF